MTGCVSHLGNREDRPYTCTRCGASLAVQFHACPVCGGFDVRRAEWIDD